MREINSKTLIYINNLGSIEKWQIEKRSSIWLYIPLSLSSFISIIAKYGFKYHHAEDDLAVMCRWLSEDRENKIPLFATHQVGVAGKKDIKMTNK